jgi:hypothetical protein
MEDSAGISRTSPSEMVPPANQPPPNLLVDPYAIKSPCAPESDAGTTISVLDLESKDPYPSPSVAEEKMTGKKLFNGERPDDAAREKAKTLTLEEQVSPICRSPPVLSVDCRLSDVTSLENPGPVSSISPVSAVLGNEESIM